MPGKKTYNSDLDLQGKLTITTVPNNTGTVLTYNSTTKEVSTRTNAEIISDLGFRNNLNIDGTGFNFPSVDAVNSGLSGRVPYTGATQDVHLNTKNLEIFGKIKIFYGNAELYGGTPVGSSSYGPILYGYDGIEFKNRSYYNSPTIFTMNGVEKARVQYNGDFKNEGVLLPQKGIIVKGFSPIVKQKAMEGNTSLIFIKTGYGESYYNMTEFKVILKTYSTSGLKHYEFIVSTYFIRDSTTNYFPNITWVAGNSTDITAIKFYKKDSGGYESYIAIEGSFDYPQISITEAQVAEGATNTIHSDVWSIDFANTADLTGKSVTNTFLPNDFKRDKTWLDANYTNQNWVNTQLGNYVTLNTNQTFIANKGFAQTSDVRFFGNEYNEVRVWRDSNGAGAGGVVSGHILNWYNSRWKVGNARSSDSSSNGYAFFFSNDDGANYSEKARISTDGVIHLNGINSLSALGDTVGLGNTSLNYVDIRSNQEINHTKSGVTKKVWTEHNFNPSDYQQLNTNLTGISNLTLTNSSSGLIRKIPGPPGSNNWILDSTAYASQTGVNTFTNVNNFQQNIIIPDATIPGHAVNAGVLNANDRSYLTDSRGAVRLPNYYDRRYAQWDFQNNADTLAGGDTWHGVLTLSKWNDYNAQHKQEQLLFTGDDLKRRTAVSDTEWGEVKTIYDSGNLNLNNYLAKVEMHGITISDTGGGAWINMPTGGYSAIGSGGAGQDAWVARTSSNGQFFTNAAAGDIIYRNMSGKLMWGNDSAPAGMYLEYNILNLLNTPKVNGYDVYHHGNLINPVKVNTPFDSINTTYGLMISDDGIGGESGLIDSSNDNIVAGRVGNIYKFGSNVNDYDGLNIDISSKQVTIGKQVTNNEDKLLIKGNVSVDSNTYNNNPTDLILNPLYNEDGDVSTSRNAHIYIRTRATVTLPQNPIVGQRIEIYNWSDNSIEVQHANIGVMFLLPPQKIARGFVTRFGFVFDEEPVTGKEFTI